MNLCVGVQWLTRLQSQSLDACCQSLRCGSLLLSQTRSASLQTQEVALPQLGKQFIIDASGIIVIPHLLLELDPATKTMISGLCTSA